MNRQRGSALFDLLLYGGIALVAVGVLAGVNAGLKSHYVGPEKAKWDKERGVLVGNRQSLEGDLRTCGNANKSLGDQFDTFREQHNAQVLASVELDKKQRADRAANEKAKAPLLAQNSMELFDIITSLGKPDGGLTCDQLDTKLLDEAKRRQKYYGPATTPPTANGLRITEPPAPAVRPPPVRPK